jgi:hypothetical protein
MIILLSTRDVLRCLTYRGIFPFYLLFIKVKHLSTQALMVPLISNFVFTLKMCLYDASKCEN